MTEIVQQWKALPEVERRDFEDRATEEQKRYLAACIKERQERCTADEAVEEEGDEPTMGAEELAVQLPLARITKANPALSPTPPLPVFARFRRTRHLHLFRGRHC